jgi:hypothetical protein
VKRVAQRHGYLALLVLQIGGGDWARGAEIVRARVAKWWAER